jgi:hypothetical protein
MNNTKYEIDYYEITEYNLNGKKIYRIYTDKEMKEFSKNIKFERLSKGNGSYSFTMNDGKICDVYRQVTYL